MQLNLISILTFIIINFPFIFTGVISMNVLSSGYINMFSYLLGLFLSIILGALIKLGVGEKSGGAVWSLRRDSYYVKKLNKFIIQTGNSCNIVEIPKIFGFDISKYSVISLYTLFYGYSWSYLVLANKLFNRKEWDSNDTFMSIIILLFSMTHIYFQANRKCMYKWEGLTGIILGLILGLLWNAVIKPDFKVKKKQRCRMGRNSVWSCEGKEENVVGIHGKFDFTKFVISSGMLSLLLVIIVRVM